MKRGRKREREREKVENSEKRGLNGSNPLRILYLKRNAVIDEMQTEFRSSAERSNRIKSNETQWSPWIPFYFLSLPSLFLLLSPPLFPPFHPFLRYDPYVRATRTRKKKNRFLPVVINSAFILSKSVEHGRFIFIPSSFAINFFSCSLQYLQKKKKIEY